MSPRKGTHRPVGRLFSFLFIPPTGLAPSIPFPLSLPFLFLIPRGIIEKKVRGRDKGNGGYNRRGGKLFPVDRSLELTGLLFLYVELQ